MYVYLSKILPLFVMPLSVAIILLLAALLFLRERRRLASGLAALAVVVLWVASMPVTATKLYRGLEAQYPPTPLADVPVSDCMVLLGGAVAPPLAPRVAIEFSEAIDRVYQAAKLYGAGKARSLIVTAGNQPWSLSPWAEADLLRELLVEWGVPSEAIFLEGSSRNTRENAIYSKNLVDSIHCEETLLVTSAAHMPRALAAFRSVGVSVIPVSTDVHVVDEGGLGPTAFLPSAGALAMTSEALREWIGQGFYALKGWN
jgi:uncharacterized SAM-binding protein YcdF (DUF218 family)